MGRHTYDFININIIAVAPARNFRQRYIEHRVSIIEHYRCLLSSGAAAQPKTTTPDNFRLDSRHMTMHVTSYIFQQLSNALVICRHK